MSDEPIIEQPVEAAPEQEIAAPEPSIEVMPETPALETPAETA